MTLRDHFKLRSGLAWASLILLAAVGGTRPPLMAWFQSPISPLLPGADPFGQPGATSLVVSAPRWMTDFWSSPWPWFGVGLVLFGGLVWGLIRWLDKRPWLH